MIINPGARIRVIDPFDETVPCVGKEGVVLRGTMSSIFAVRIDDVLQVQFYFPEELEVIE